MTNEYLKSVASAFAILLGAMALVTVGASLYDVDSPFELLWVGVAGGLPLVLLVPLFDDADHPADRLALALLVTFLSGIAFAVADALLSWIG